MFSNIPSKAAKVANQKRFLRWLEAWNPQLHAAAVNAANAVTENDTGLGALNSWWDSFTDKISQLGSKYVQFRTQKEILDAQMERMRQGLPPLETGQYAPTVAIKPDAGTTAEITSAIGSGIGKLSTPLMLAAAALGFFFLTKKRR